MLEFKAEAAAPVDADDRANRVRVSKKRAEFRRDGSRSGGAASLDSAVEEQLSQQEGQRGRKRSSLEVVRYIGNRTFYKRGEQWEEATYDAGKDGKAIKTIEVGSDEYLQLLQEDPRLAKYLALGDVLLKVKKTWYRVETRKRG